MIVEYGDYECPKCSASHHVVQEALAARPDIGYVYRHLPSRTHVNAITAAEAAEAAGSQQRFWEMHDMLFEKQAEWYRQGNAIGTFRRYAAEIGLDAEQFEKDLATHRFRDVVVASQAGARNVGVPSAPALFVDGQRLKRVPRDATELLSELVPVEQH